MPTFRDIFLGTPAELQARTTIAELDNQQKLRARDLKRLADARGISRRLLLRQGAIGAGAALVVATAGSLGWLGLNEYNRHLEEERFWTEIDRQPTNQKVAAIDNFYSQKRLSVGVATSKVVPVWLQSFIENGQSNVDPNEVLSRVQFSDDRLRNSNAKGGVYVNFEKRSVGDPRFTFDEFPSNELKKQGDDSAFGIVFLRSIFTHEMGHFDPPFRDVTALTTLLKSQGLLNNAMENPVSGLTHGFQIALMAGDGTKQSYAAGFDEAATDVRTAYINSKAKVKTAYGYSTSFYLKNFLEWINYDSERFISLHRTSDVEQFARDLGKKVIEINKGAPDPNLELLEGFKTIFAFNTANKETLEALFPGFNSAILSKPGKMII